MKRGAASLRLMMYSSLLSAKQPLFIISVLVIVFITLNNANSLFKMPYESKVQYEEKLGYIKYEDFINMTFTEFDSLYFDKFGEHIKQEYSFLTYIDKMSVEQRTMLEYDKVKSADKYDAYFNEMINGKYIQNVQRYTFFELKNLSKEQYDLLSHSLFTPGFSSSALYFQNNSNYSSIVLEYPTYSEMLEIIKKENMSYHIAREYYFRLMIPLSLLLIILIVDRFSKDYKYNSELNLYMCNVKGSRYIFANYFGILFPFIIASFIISSTWAFIYVANVNASIWVYSALDFVKAFFLFPFSSLIYISAVALLCVMLMKSSMLSLAITFYYSFIFSNITYNPDGTTEWQISWLNYFPRLPFRYGIMNDYKVEVMIHQLAFLLLAVVIVIISGRIWERRRNHCGELI